MMSIKTLIEKKQKERERAAMKDKAKKVALGTAVGTAIGAAVGILFAPKAGKETREDIAKGAKEAAETIKETVAETKEKIITLIEEKRAACCSDVSCEECNPAAVVEIESKTAQDKK